MVKRVAIFFFLVVQANTCLAQDPEQDLEPKDQSPETSQEKKKQKTTKDKSPKIRSSIFRSFLTQFTLSLSGGYGPTFYSHDLKDMAIFQPAEGERVFIYNNVFFGDNPIPVVYQDWVNNPAGIGGLLLTDSVPPIITNGIPILPNDLIISSDSMRLGYKSLANGFPFTIQAFMDVDRYRIGGGATIEFQKMGRFKPKTLKDTLRGFDVNFSMATFKRYFGYVGIIVYESWQYKMLADLQFGKINRGKNFNKDIISGILYFNGGYTVEKSLSEYFKVFVRPSVEWKSYTISTPEGGLEITHLQPSIFFQVGATIRMPRLPRCPVPGCNIQINHVHSGKEYRSKVHPIWKWQNPNYGQNYPKLLKDKGMERR